jgi:hypothetical protein
MEDFARYVFEQERNEQRAARAWRNVSTTLIHPGLEFKLAS